jgi:hypothetical protein
MNSKTCLLIGLVLFLAVFVTGCTTTIPVAKNDQLILKVNEDLLVPPMGMITIGEYKAGVRDGSIKGN